MKKLLLLFLVLTGMVSTASADRTIYIQNTQGYTNLHVYMWGGTSPTTWPGTKINGGDAIETIDNKGTYEVNLGDHTYFIVNDGSDDNKTANIELTGSNYPNGTYYKIEGSGNGGVTLSQITVYSYTINVTATHWSTPNIHYWNAVGGTAWPGAEITTGSYSFKASTSSVNVIFNNSTHQTCNMTAEEGTNNYYICSAFAGDGGVWGETVKTNSEGYATYVNTKNLEIPANTAYYAVDNGNGSATAHAITSVAGGTAMLIKGNANTTYHFGTISSGTDYSSTNAFHAGSGVALGATDGGGHNYILKGDAFYLANGNTVASTKAYLKLSQAATSRVLKFADDETDAISAVTSIADNGGAYYNLSGQRIANPTKGLYIRGGKKVMVK